MNATALLTLQDIDSALAAVANRRPRLPELVAHRAATAALSEHQARIATAQARIDAAQAAIESAEHASADITTKRTRLEAQLKTVIAPREAEALMHQIATLNAQRDELDEQELTALDEQAAGDDERVALLASLPDLEARLRPPRPTWPGRRPSSTPRRPTCVAAAPTHCRRSPTARSPPTTGPASTSTVSRSLGSRAIVATGATSTCRRPRWTW